MNYRNFFKQLKSSGKILLPEGVDTEQLKMGIKAEKEHTKDVGIAAKIALDHLKEDPKYYTKLGAAGLEESEPSLGRRLYRQAGYDDEQIDDAGEEQKKEMERAKASLASKSNNGWEKAKSAGQLAKEHCGVCQDDMEVDDNGGLPLMGGALAIPHVGQPIHMSKIIQFGPLNRSGGQTASGELSGMTTCDKAGVTKDKGGIPVQPDSEPITAGGKTVDSSIASKSVGGPVTSNKGEKQGGPNSQGTIANTAKMNEGKLLIRKLAKEALKEITFDKKSGKWVRINEYSLTGKDDGDGLPLPGHDPVDRSGDYGEQRGMNPIGESEINELGGHYCFNGCGPTSTRIEHGKAVCAKCHKPFDKNTDLDNSDGHKGWPGDGSGEDDLADYNTGEADDYRDETEESVDMKMGKSYKTVQPRMYKTSDDDFARTNQYDPQITEMYDEEEITRRNDRITELATAQRNLTEDELAELNKLSEDFGEDDYERRKWQQGISRHNRNNPQRFECPTCHTPNALSAWEKKKGYQCNACANAEEGPMGSGEWEEGKTNEGWAMGEYTAIQEKAIDLLQAKGFREVSSFPAEPDAEGQPAEGSQGVVVVLQKKQGPVRLSCEVDPEGMCNGQPVEQFMQTGMNEASYKVVSPTLTRTSKDDHARTVQTEPTMTENDDDDDDSPSEFDGDDSGEDYAGDAGACSHCGNVNGNTSMGSTAQCARCGEQYEIDVTPADDPDLTEEPVAEPEVPVVPTATPSAAISATPSAPKAKRGRKPKDEDPLVDGEECSYCTNRLGNTKVDVNTGKYTCHRCGEEFIPGQPPPEDIESDEAEPSASDLDKAEKPDTEFIRGLRYDDEEDDSIYEAGGHAVQHSSYRTVDNGNLPQSKDQRVAADMDEAAIKQKKSDTVKAIQKGQKAKSTQKKKNPFKYTAPRSTKSGVHKKKS